MPKGNYKVYRVEQMYKFLFIKYWNKLPNEYKFIDEAKIAMMKLKAFHKEEISKWYQTIVEINKGGQNG